MSTMKHEHITEGVIIAYYHVYIVELKSAVTLTDAHEAQLINYLKATGIEVGLLLNFGPKAQVRRKVYSRATNGAQSFSYPRSSA